MEVSDDLEGGRVVHKRTLAAILFFGDVFSGACLIPSYGPRPPTDAAPRPALSPHRPRQDFPGLLPTPEGDLNPPRGRRERAYWWGFFCMDCLTRRSKTCGEMNPNGKKTPTKNTAPKAPQTGE